jgi:O-antigen/teichoic acid export membrane protein
MGLIWAVGGLLLGGVIELVDNVLPAAHPFTRLVDMWPQSLAMLAFPHGVIFAVVLGVVGSRRRFEEFSLSAFAGWGAVAGLLFGVVELALGAGVAFVGVTTLLSAVAGASSLVLARTAERRGLLGAGTHAAELGRAG